MSLTFRDLAATAGLLHDLGKFRQRCGVPGSHAEIGAKLVDEFAHLFPYEWLDDLRDAVGNHHRPPRKEVEELVKLADWFASGERESGEGIARRDPGEAALVPITSRVELLYDGSSGEWGYRLRPLALEEETIFPALDVRLGPEAYRRQWEGFITDLLLVPRIQARHQLSTLVAVLRKYACFVPSATPWEEDEEFRTLPDISLYDHLKVTAAIAAVLTGVLPDEVDALLRRDKDTWARPVCVAIRADLSGIQAFIYRVTEGGAKGKGTAKRLRGRSLYVTWLAEAMAQSLLSILELPSTNLLYCGGGRLDLLAPLGSETAIATWTDAVEQFLVQEYGGILGVQVAFRTVCPQDFETYASVYEDLDATLRRAKQRKFASLLAAGFPEIKMVHHVCPTCDLSPVPEPSVCQPCQDHHKIGGDLPRATHLVWLPAGQDLPGLEGFFEWPEPIRLRVGLLANEGLSGALRAIHEGELRAEVTRLNDTDFLAVPVRETPSTAAFSFRFLANRAPFDKHGGVLEFSEIAERSQGAAYLGLLKADVDHLGLVFRRGLAKGMSISRLATLSSMIDLFFTGWVGWLGDQTAKRIGHSENPFYTMYAGGDDLLVIGPWDAAIAFAEDLREHFQRFCCSNPNLTLSAAVECIKPHFPVRRFAGLLVDAIESAKEAGRNRVRVFGTTVPWADGTGGFDKLLELGRMLADAVDDKRIPRTLVHDLLRVYDQYMGPESRGHLGWTYRVLYTLARRVAREVVEELDLFHRIPAAMPYLRIPASYTILATRRG
jgi:CRISPR-associated protein Csm1